MRASFDAALPLVLKHEGGWVNDPLDPGGETNKGITQHTYNVWRVDHQLPARSVKHITASEICAIYKKRYWDAVKGDLLPAGLDYCLFDFGVNSGPARASRYLQEAVGAIADGKIGPNTLEAVSGFPAPALIDAVCNMRLAFLKRQPTFHRFGKGWTRRVEDVRAKAKEMAA